MHGAPSQASKRHIGSIKKTVWDRSVTTKPQYKIVSTTVGNGKDPVLIPNDVVWTFNRGLPDNNKDEKAILKQYRPYAKLVPFTFYPGSCVEYIKGTQKFSGRIDKLTLDASIDASKVTQDHYLYTIVDPIDPSIVMTRNVTANKLTATYLSSNYKEKLEKMITNILFVSTTPLKLLDPMDLKEWYDGIRKILKAYDITLLPWNQVIESANYTTFCGAKHDNDKANKLFMFLSRDYVLPAFIEDTRNKIALAPNHDGYMVLWKIIQENHPELQDHGADTIWPAYNNRESFNTYLL